MNIPFKGESRLARLLHGWQSSYATDCRSVDPGANPGPCSNILIVVRLHVWGYLILPIYEELNKTDTPLALEEGTGPHKYDSPLTNLEHSSSQAKLRLVASILDLEHNLLQFG